MKPKLLLVDDHEIVRWGLASLLESDCEICGHASNGEEALLRVRELKPDLVILDLSMRVMSGTEAARKIRSMNPHAKIIFLSMHDSEYIEELGKLAGVDAYLSKSCSPAKLKQTIAAVLGIQKEKRFGFLPKGRLRGSYQPLFAHTPSRSLQLGVKQKGALHLHPDDRPLSVSAQLG